MISVVWPGVTPVPGFPTYEVLLVLVRVLRNLPNVSLSNYVKSFPPDHRRVLDAGNVEVVALHQVRLGRLSALRLVLLGVFPLAQVEHFEVRLAMS